MAVKIRLMRIGAKKRPFYRVVAIDAKKKRTGGYLELLGTYNPLTKPKEINLKQDLIDKWLKLGAQPSDGFLRIIGQAPQRPPRKPKKAQPEPRQAPKTAETTTPEEVVPTGQPTNQVESSQQLTAEDAAQNETEAPETASEKQPKEDKKEEDNS